jgi:hypothetical protein
MILYLLLFYLFYLSICCFYPIEQDHTYNHIYINNSQDDNDNDMIYHDSDDDVFFDDGFFSN